MTDYHRIALEPRGSGSSEIWLMFYEALVTSYSKVYEQQLLRIFKNSDVAKAFDIAKAAAILEFRKRQISAPLIIRDDSEKDEMLRKA